MPNIADPLLRIQVGKYQEKHPEKVKTNLSLTLTPSLQCSGSK